MPDLSLIMLGAGSSSRFKMSAKKQWLRIDHTPLWLFATNNLTNHLTFKKIIIVCSPNEIDYMKLFSTDFLFIKGGKSRTESLKNALEHVETQKVLVSDVARACIPTSMIERIIAAPIDADVVVPYLHVSDTVVYENETIDRDKIKLIQTPQLSTTQTLKSALKRGNDFTDESSAIRANGGKVTYILGDKRANKVTFDNDLEILSQLEKPSCDTFIGNGYDVHQFELGKPMWLGGINIKSDRGFKAHSDGDVAIHALIDALLGASGAGDIGELFPDSDATYKNIDSKELLKKVISFIKIIGFEIINCDITIMAETPKLSSYKYMMRETLATLLGVSPAHVNIKATTTEKLGFIGREEGVAVSATAALRYYDWKKQL